MSAPDLHRIGVVARLMKETIGFPTDQPACYTLYDEAGKVIYIGATADIGPCVRAHLSADEPIAVIRNEFTKITIIPCETEKEAKTREVSELAAYMFHHHGARPIGNEILPSPPKPKEKSGAADED